MLYGSCSRSSSSTCSNKPPTSAFAGATTVCCCRARRAKFGASHTSHNDTNRSFTNVQLGQVHGSHRRASEAKDAWSCRAIESTSPRLICFFGGSSEICGNTGPAGGHPPHADTSRSSSACHPSSSASLFTYACVTACVCLCLCTHTHTHTHTHKPVYVNICRLRYRPLLPVR